MVKSLWYLAIAIALFVSVPAYAGDNNNQNNSDFGDTYNITETTNNEGGSGVGVSSSSSESYSESNLENTNVSVTSSSSEGGDAYSEGGSASQNQSAVGNVDVNSSVNSGTSVNAPVDVNVGGDTLTDESVYTSLATSQQKTEMSVGVPGVLGVTLSDTDKFAQWDRLLTVTLALKDAGIITAEEAQARISGADDQKGYLDRLEREAKKPSGRTLFNAFGLLF